MLPVSGAKKHETILRSIDGLPQYRVCTISVAQHLMILNVSAIRETLSHLYIDLLCFVISL
jgi:hypothetical protein